MSIINVTNVEVLDNPTKFTTPFQFQITFDCAAPGIKGELEWKLVYVGSAEDEKYDQELDCVLVGPVAIGKNKFVFQAPAPDPSKIPTKDLLEVTVILLTCSYNDSEFIRIGYYVNNDFGPNDPYKEQMARETKAAQDAASATNAANAAAHAAAVAAANAARNAAGGAAAAAAGMELERPAAAPAAPPAPAQVAPAAVVHPWAATAHQHIDQLHRNILADKPRVTRFQIPWDNVLPAATATAAAPTAGAAAAAAAAVSGAAAQASHQQQMQQKAAAMAAAQKSASGMEMD